MDPVGFQNGCMLAAVDWGHLAVSVLGGAALALGIVGLFGHSGRTEISPQRRIAVATGHADRRTVFESNLLAPLMWLLLQLMTKLAVPGAKRRLRATLIAAGSPKFYTAEEYMALSALRGLAAGAALMGATILYEGSASLVAGIIGFVGAFVLSVYRIYEISRKRVRQISRRVPYTLDLVGLAMGAGSTFTEAVRTVAGEDPDHPMNVELQTVLAEIDLGTTRQQALANLADRVTLESLRGIVASIIQAEQLGTPLEPVLKDQSTLLRLHRSVRAEKLAALASVRILVPSVLILFSVVLTVFAPLIVSAVRGSLF